MFCAFHTEKNKTKQKSLNFGFDKHNVQKLLLLHFLFCFAPCSFIDNSACYAFLLPYHFSSFGKLRDILKSGRSIAFEWYAYLCTSVWCGMALKSIQRTQCYHQCAVKSTDNVTRAHCMCL